MRLIQFLYAIGERLGKSANSDTTVDRKPKAAWQIVSGFVLIAQMVFALVILIFGFETVVQAINAFRGRGRVFGGSYLGLTVSIALFYVAQRIRAKIAVGEANPIWAALSKW